jgi:hypothetical protein
MEKMSKSVTGTKSGKGNNMSTKINIKDSTFERNTQVGSVNSMGAGHSPSSQSTFDADISVENTKFNGDVQIGNNNVITNTVEVKKTLESVRKEVSESSSVSAEQKKT